MLVFFDDKDWRIRNTPWKNSQLELFIINLRSFVSVYNITLVLMREKERGYLFSASMSIFGSLNKRMRFYVLSTSICSDWSLRKKYNTKTTRHIGARLDWMTPLCWHHIWRNPCVCEWNFFIVFISRSRGIKTAILFLKEHLVRRYLVHFQRYFR